MLGGWDLTGGAVVVIEKIVALLLSGHHLSTGWKVGIYEGRVIIQVMGH